MERSRKGQFVNGNSASAGVSEGKTGRPPRKREERFYDITLRACTYSDWRKIVKKAVKQALEGDHRARKFLADYIIGPPLQRQEISGPEGGAVVIVKMTGNMEPDDV